MFDIESSNEMASISKGITGNRTAYVNYIPNTIVFYYGTTATSGTSSVEIHEYIKSGGSGVGVYCTHTYYAVYDGNARIDIYVASNNNSIAHNIARRCIVPEVMGYSSLSVLPTPIYIDLDIGEAYGEYSGVYASVNNIVKIPAKLPTLGPGSNSITFDNTITDLKVTPRWWKV